MRADKGRYRLTAGMFIVPAVLLLAAALLYREADPASSALFPKCPFHLLTGLECPGCGSQRAIHSLLNGDMRAAVHYNLLLVLAIPYLGLLAALEMIRHILLPVNVPEKIKSKVSRGISKAVAILYHGRAAWIVLTVVLLFWLLRNFTAAF